jgi:hypothetical protein
VDQLIAAVVLVELQAQVAQPEALVVWVQLGSLACQVSTVTQPRSQVKHASSEAAVVVAVGQAMGPGSMVSAVKAAVEPVLMEPTLWVQTVCPTPVAVVVLVKLAVPTVELVALEL